ncbi:MAG: hypothetical protein K2Y05_11100, partial [Hyphomicrobiaceae bacterium]|nr:hypothetical protein [Hyphomicrobiaceae bacterium]
VAATPRHAFAWGATGHGVIGALAIEALASDPAGPPAFNRTPDAARLIDAWAARLDARVGYPEVAVKAIIAKPSILTPYFFGID